MTIYDAGAVTESMRAFGWVRLFTPFEMNSTERGRSRLAATGAAVPRLDALLTAGELVATYLEPLTRLPELAGRVRERSRVTNVGREGMRKSGGNAASGNQSRAGRPFLLRVEPEGGAPRFDRADAVIDATGVYASPRPAGVAGLHALGEERLGDAIERHVTPIATRARERYAGRRVLLIGDGFSAATALAELDELARSGAAARVTWVRPTRGGAPFPVRENDAIPERSSLASRGNAIARSAPWLEDAAGASVESYERDGDAWRATLRATDGSSRAVGIDRVLALVGYQPDASIHRELQIHLCYTSEGPMALASAVLAASVGDPTALADCLKQKSHGPDVMKNPEPDYYIVGSKSYGRSSAFVLPLGHRQILDVIGLIEAAHAAAPAPAAR